MNFITQYLGVCRDLSDISASVPYNSMEFTRLPSNAELAVDYEIVAFYGVGCQAGEEAVTSWKTIQGKCVGFRGAQFGSVMMRERVA